MSETKAPYGEPQRARLTRQGQITVPKAVREALDAKPGDELFFEQRGEEMLVRHVRRKSILDFAGIAADTAPAAALTKERLVQAVETAVGEAYQAKLQRMVDADSAEAAS